MTLSNLTSSFEPMGSTSPQSQLYKQQSPRGLPTQFHNSRQFATPQSTEMDSQAVKDKATIASVYPSPADDIAHTFSAPSSPLFKEDQQILSRSPPSNHVTLPPLRSVVQMPSPSSSPQMPVASHKSIADDYFKSSGRSGSVGLRGGGTSVAFDRFKDAPLYPEGTNAFSTSSDLKSLFHPPTFHVAGQNDRQLLITSSSQAQLNNNQTSATKRKRKAVAHPAHSMIPGAVMYGAGNFWARMAQDPVYHSQETSGDLKQYWPSKQASQESTRSSTRSSLDNTTAVRLPQKRKADSVVSPPKRHQKAKDGFKVPQMPSASASPQEAPLDAAGKKRMRRPSEATKAKAARAPSEKVERDYMLYPDYCPPLSTLDSDDVSFPNIDWKAAPHDLHNHPDRHLLHPKELAVASKLVLSCSVYLYIKRRFFASRYQYACRDQKFNINAAQIACKGLDEHGITGIDVNKTSRLHKAFDKVGWLDKKHMDRFM